MPEEARCDEPILSQARGNDECLRASAPCARAVWQHLACIFAFQLLHWFKPSEPFFADFVLPKYNITQHTLTTDVYAWDMIAQHGTGLLAAGILSVFGIPWALLSCAIAAVATVSVVLLSDNVSQLLLSQFLWALSFAITFIMPVSLFIVLSPRHFQLAASINSCAMLCGSLMSSIIGFVITEFYPGVGIEFTFYMSLASSVASLLCLLLALKLGLLILAKPTTLAKSPTNALEDNRCADECHPASEHWSMRCVAFSQHFKLNFLQPRVILWITTSAVVRGFHTQIITLWPLLSLDIAYSEQAFNGMISSCAYIVAALVVLTPIKLELQVRTWANSLILCSFLSSALSLFAMSAADDLWVLGLMLVCYHCISEFILAVAAVQILSSMKTDCKSKLYESQYLAMIASKYILALVVQGASQLFIWPRWGHVNNVLGMDLTVKDQFLAFSYVYVAYVGFVLVAHLARWFLNSAHPDKMVHLDTSVADAAEDRYVKLASDCESQAVRT